MAYYSGSVADVKYVMKAVGIGTSREDSITETDVAEYQKRADTVINSRLSGSYYLPLRQLVEDSVTKFPDPIPYVAQLLTACLIYRAFYTEMEPNMSTSIEAYQKQVDAELAGIVTGAGVGANILRGQRLMARNHFQNPRIAPAENPKEARM